jgi:hypothetical protein
MISELIHNMGHSSAQAFYGVPAIYIYLVIIVAVAFYRIKQFKNDHH